MSISCEELFESTIEIEIPESLDRLVLISDISTLRDTVRFQITHSQNILDENSDIVDLDLDRTEFMIRSADKSYAPPLRHTDLPFFYEMDILEEFFIPGTEVEIMLSNPLYPNLSARAKVAAPPAASNFRYKVDAAKDFDGDDLDELSFDIDDDPGVENFYLVSAELLIVERYDVLLGDLGDTTFFRKFLAEIYLVSDGITIEEGSDGKVLFSDRSFSGQKFNIHIRSYGLPLVDGRKTLFVSVKSISHDRYLYEKSLGALLLNDGNPFVEPANVHSNIEGGFGIFSIDAEVVSEVEIIR
ncbi:MAG: DUF4249 family protein [Saprospiraceae bacterium]|nr:DUF4249 family protein [Saprospiraceae bacterium]